MVLKMHLFHTHLREPPVWACIFRTFGPAGNTTGNSQWGIWTHGLPHPWLKAKHGKPLRISGAFRRFARFFWAGDGPMPRTRGILGRAALLNPPGSDPCFRLLVLCCSGFKERLSWRHCFFWSWVWGDPDFQEWPARIFVSTR